MGKRLRRAKGAIGLLVLFVALATLAAMGSGPALASHDGFHWADDPENNAADWRDGTSKPTCDTYNGDLTISRDQVAYDDDPATPENECLPDGDLTSFGLRPIIDSSWRGGGYLEASWSISGTLPTPSTEQIIYATGDQVLGYGFGIDIVNPTQQYKRQTIGDTTACDRYVHNGPFFYKDGQWVNLYYALTLEAIPGKVDPTSGDPIGLWSEEVGYGTVDSATFLQSNTIASGAQQSRVCTGFGAATGRGPLEDDSGTFPTGFTSYHPVTGDLQFQGSTGKAVEVSDNKKILTVRYPFTFRDIGDPVSEFALRYDYRLADKGDTIFGIRATGETSYNYVSVPAIPNPFGELACIDDDLDPETDCLSLPGPNLVDATYLRQPVLQDWAPWASQDLGPVVPLIGPAQFTPGPTCPEYFAQEWHSGVGFIRITKEAVEPYRDTDYQWNPLFSTAERIADGDNGLNHYDSQAAYTGTTIAHSASQWSTPTLQDNDGVDKCHAQNPDTSRYAYENGEEITVPSS